MKENDIVIIGGGLAGLTAAIHLAMNGQQVMVFESNPYPHHKVCGEYVSKEIEPYLKRLGIDLAENKAIDISKFEMSTHGGKSIKADLPLGGIGISRFKFDDLLYRRAMALGVKFHFEKVVDLVFQNDAFEIKTSSRMVNTKIAIGAYGKRSILDKKLNRNFSTKKQSWLAIKSHYSYPNFPDNLVALHNFDGGYGGLSKTESGSINFCYLVNYKEFKKFKDVHHFNEKIVAKNPVLGEFLEKATPLFSAPMTIAQISFDKKESVENHVLMCGDTAGLIHPLCGNGMAMAIHSAKIVSDLVLRFFNDSGYKRAQLERDYTVSWKKAFARRLWIGRKLQSVLMNKTMVTLGIKTLGTSTKLVRYIISKTHGALIQ